MATTFLERIDTVLVDGRAAAEQARRFLAANVLPARRARAEDPLPDLLRSACDRVELSTGYRYLFENNPGLASRIAAAIEHERQSGRCLRFQVVLDVSRGPVTMDVSGPATARAFLAALDAPDPQKAQDFANRLLQERRKAWIRKAG